MELEFNNRYLTFAHFLEHFSYNTVIHIFICCFFAGDGGRQDLYTVELVVTTGFIVLLKNILNAAL